MNGPLWARMNFQKRWSPATLRTARVPTGPGVYAWYRAGIPVYVGKAASLKRRLVTEHCDTRCDLSRSAFRRNVGEMLGIATMAQMKARPSVLSASQVAPVSAWIDACEAAWIECDTEADAKHLEDEMKAEWKPTLTKR